MTNPIGFVLPAASLGLGALLFRPQRGFFKSGTKDPILVPHAVVEERHSHRLQITEHPVQQGSVIADHAFMLPKKVVVRCIWSNSPPPSKTAGSLLGAAALAAAQFGGQKIATAAGIVAAAGPTVDAVTSLLSGNGPDQAREIFKKLKELQESRVPFDLYTGKDAYTDMLIEEIGVETSLRWENSLSVVVGCHQLIFATPSAISVPINVLSLNSPEKNLPSVDGGGRNLTPAPNFNSTTVP